MAELIQYGFKEHPFPLLPGSRVTNWAGMQDVRLKLQDVAKSILRSDSGLSEFVILHGTYGSGKTHALKYMTTIINEIEEDTYRAKAIYVPKIKLGSKVSFQEIYKHVMQTLGEDFLKNLANNIRSSVDQAVIDRGSTGGSNGIANVTAEVLEELPHGMQSMVKLLMEIQSNANNILQFLMRGNHNPTISKSGYTQPISNDYMAIQILSDLFSTMTQPIGSREPSYDGVHLFIDEVEDILEAKSAEQLDFWASLRELVNRLPENFALLLSFSADAALLEVMMPMGIMERTTRPNIELQALEIDEAKDFIAKQLADFRPDEYDPPQPYHPFTEEAIDYLLEQIVVLVPRRIFRGLRQIFDRSIKREGLQPGEEIDIDMMVNLVEQTGIV